MPYSTKVIRQLEELDPKLKGVFLTVLEEIEKSVKETVKRTDFLELKEIVAELGRKVAELAESQKKSEERLTRLEMTVRELAEAQKKTEETVRELGEAQKKSEERLARVEKAVEGLAEAQRRTEERLNELAEAQKKTEERLNELAEAQKKTEERLNELAEAQKKTEERLNELAEAQRKTEQELRELVQEHRKTRELVGNLSDTVGYGLEDRIMPYIPFFGMKEYGINVELVERRNVIYPDGKYDEVNIYVEGRKDGEKVYMIGECKAKPGKKDIERFSSLIRRLSNYLKAPIYPFVVGYTYTPDVEAYIREKHPEVRMVKSFEFELKYSGRSSRSSR